MVCRLYNDSFIRAAGVFNILRPFLLLFRFALSLRSFACFATPFLRRPRHHLLFFLFHMFERFHCWYYGLVFEYINLSNIDCGSDHQSERSERLYHPPSILTFGSYLRRPHQPFFFFLFHMFERFHCWYYGIMN